MTEPHGAVIARLSADFAAISQYMARVSTDLTALDRLLSEQPAPAPQPTPAFAGYPQPYAPPAVPYWPQHQPPSAPPRRARSEGWIGKVLAVAGVAVTLIGVVLLLVLAAQAGILRPEIRVGAGAVLAGALVVVAGWLYARPGGRVGAIALAATGIAAAYMDVIAVTTIYEWVVAPIGLAIAAVIGGSGLTLARRWDSQHLGLLVLVPLIALAPVVTDGITLLLVGFMLALSAASLMVQLGKDWIWLHAARIAAPTLPLLVALAALYFDGRHDMWLAGACGISAVLAIAAALILLPRTRNRAAMTLLTAAGARVRGRRHRAPPELRAAEFVGRGDPDGRGGWDFYAGFQPAGGGMRGGDRLVVEGRGDCLGRFRRGDRLRRHHLHRDGRRL